MTGKATKYFKLAEQLRRDIAQASPGTAFMTVRQIMEKSKMSQATTTKALEILDREGLIERSLGSGIYIKDKATLLKSRTATICLAMPNWPSSRLQSYELSFHELACEMGFIPETLRFAWSDAVPLKLPPMKIDALAIYSAAQEKLLLPKLPALEALGTPYAFISRDLGEIGVNCVYCDDRDEGAMAANHLIKTGHSRIAALISEPRTGSIDEKVEGFVKYAKLQNVEATVIDTGMKNGELSYEATYQTMKRVLAQGKPPFSAIFIVSNEPAMALYKAVSEAGLNIPEDICAIAASDTVQGRYLHPSLSCISEKPEEILRSAVKLLMGQAGGKGGRPQRVSIPPELIARDSTKRKDGE